MVDVPKIGEKYYNFKSIGGEDHLYEIVGIGAHTETDEVLVVYRPMYHSEYLKEKGADVFIRPLSNFLEYINKEDYKGARFYKVN